MAIIYSYPKANSVLETDSLIISRFEEESPTRTMNADMTALLGFLQSNIVITVPNLDEVLTEGNESGLSAKINGIFLLNENVPSGGGYVSINGDKNRVNFYDNTDAQYAYLSQDTLFLKNASNGFGLSIKKPVTTATNITATFQNTSGTVAYLSDLDTLNLNEVLTNGNVSLLDASIGTLGLWDNFNEAYGFVNSNRNRLNFTNSDGFLVGYLAEDTLTLNDSDTAFNFQIKKPTVITANRTATFQNASGTVAYLSDIPAVPVSNNYGLFAQTGNSTPISGTNVETTLINGGVGTLTVPANGFTVGDSFRAVFGGVLNAANNQTIRIRVKSGSVILLDSGAQPVSNITNNVFSFNIDFTIRQLGAAGTASIVSLGSFHYKKTVNGVVEGFAFNVINNTTFNTTISNTLDVTVQWGSNNATNSIYSDIFILNKTY
jgi:hypothetical protein